MALKTTALSASRPGASVSVPASPAPPCPGAVWEEFFYRLLHLDELRREREAEEKRVAVTIGESPAKESL